MQRTTRRVQFLGHANNELAGILELPANEPQGFLLFSHCFTCTKDLKAIVRISRILADRGWGVLRYDLSGLGNSQGDFSQTNFTTNREDLRAASTFLAKEFEPVHFLVGHSFGGAASLSMASELESVLGAVAIAAPSDTVHLATLLLKMAPEIESVGSGQVTIGGKTYTILRQMLTDFRAQEHPKKLQTLTKPVLVFHSPTDETLGFHHAIINCGLDAASASGVARNRSLISLPNCNHLLTTRDEDCVLVGEMIDVWCRRLR